MAKENHITPAKQSSFSMDNFTKWVKFYVDVVYRSIIALGISILFIILLGLVLGHYGINLNPVLKFVISFGFMILITPLFRRLTIAEKIVTPYLNFLQRSFA